MRNSTYGAGYRAGMAPKYLIKHPDSTKTINPARCPFSKRQFISRFLWWEGYHAGISKSLQNWMQNRKGARA